ncbi:MAG: hypothetical protein U0670_10750 [Anaerolineae bacterium]
MLTIAAPTIAEPNRLLTPDQVVEIQLSALKLSGSGHCRYLDVAYAFTSSTHRTFVGSLHRFSDSMASPAYNPLITFERADLGPILIVADIAQIRVRVSGKHGRAVFTYLLSVQPSGPFANCWMIDSIIRES